ncbi:Uncharacterised protein [Escherichia coli]|uniref:Uncharacterized protein n=1 Tax=Escherichia coli TaxID=562 RepID=A0A377CAX6_ECOLX|nr:Uncharacterised protein [Escherichia coli]
MILIVIKRHMPCDGGSLLHGHIADTGKPTPAVRPQTLSPALSRYTTPHFTRVLHQLRYVADIKMVIEFIARRARLADLN